MKSIMKKVALITGASSGLGFEFSKILGKQDYVIINLARNKEKIVEAEKQLSADGIESHGFSCDVTDEISMNQMFKEISKQYKQIDFLILNAGVVSTKLLSEFNVSDMRRDLEINLWGAILTAYTFQPMLVSGSKIVMVSSAFGLIGVAGYSIYNASKAGMVNFGEALRRELLPKNINVYVATPGDMDTLHYRNEIANQPLWMKSDSPRKCMKVDVAAAKILKQCKGKRKFLIVTGADVKLLIFVIKFLPRKWRDALLDSMFPKPKLI